MLEKRIHDRLTWAGLGVNEVTFEAVHDLDWRAMARLRGRSCPTGLALAVVA